MLTSPAGEPARSSPIGWDSESTVALCALAALFTVACMMPMQNDSWWHLRAGREMWARQVVLLHDEFSFTATGAAWPNHEWLSEVIFYGVYRLGGLPGLTMFAAAAITAAVALAWKLMAGSASQRLIFMAVAMSAIVPVWTVRPHVFTLLLLLVTCHLTLRERYWSIPLVFVVWANLHGGVALGLVALGGAAAGAMYAGGWLAARPIVVTAALSVAATFVTPLGASLWTTIPESVHKSTANGIIEWRPPSIAGADLIFWVSVAVLLATTWQRRRSIRTRQDAIIVGIALALAPLAVRYSRNIPAFLLIALPAISQDLSRIVAMARPPRRGNLRVNFAVCAVWLALCGLVIAAVWRARPERLGWDPLPPSVAGAVGACGGRVYNAYEDGGYLIWFTPQVPVFVDSRQDPYPLEFLQEYIANETTGNYKPMFERYGISCAVLRDTSATAARLQQDGWETRLKAGRWVVLEARSGQRLGNRKREGTRVDGLRPAERLDGGAGEIGYLADRSARGLRRLGDEKKEDDPVQHGNREQPHPALPFESGVVDNHTLSSGQGRCRRGIAADTVTYRQRVGGARYQIEGNVTQS